MTMPPLTPGYRKRITSLLFCLLLLRFWLGQTCELTGEEAYSWQKGENLDWAYWDQGPLVPWLIKLGTLFFGATELGVRWLAAVIYVGAGFLLFYQARHWFGARTAFWSVILWMVAPVFAVDLLFMTESTVSVGLMALCLFVYRLTAQHQRWYWWALAGLTSGVALLVSWSNIFWPLGFLIFLFADPQTRPHLRGAALWCGLPALLLPLWPVAHWAMLPEVADLTVFQPRVPQVVHGTSLAYEIWRLSPLVAAAVGVGVVQVLRTPELRRDRRYAVLLCLGLPGLFWQIGADVVQHQDIHALTPLYVPLFLLACAYWLERLASVRPLQWAAVIVLAAAALESVASVVPITARWLPVRTVLRHDYSWKVLADEVVRVQEEKGATMVIGENPEIASALSFYLPNKSFVYVPRSEGVKSQYNFWAGYEDSIGSSAIVVTAQRRPVPVQIAREFATVEALDSVIPGDQWTGWRLFVARRLGGLPEEAAPAQTP